MNVDWLHCYSCATMRELGGKKHSPHILRESDYCFQVILHNFQVVKSSLLTFDSSTSTTRVESNPPQLLNDLCLLRWRHLRRNLRGLRDFWGCHGRRLRWNGWRQLGIPALAPNMAGTDWWKWLKMTITCFFAIDSLQFFCCLMLGFQNEKP